MGPPVVGCKAGVIILLLKDLPCTIQSIISDYHLGHKVSLGLQFSSRTVQITNIFAPNSHSSSLFKDTPAWIMQHPLSLHIVGGYFNKVMHPDEDRRSRKRHRARSGATLTHAESPLSHMMSALNVIDPWHLSHPTDKEFTFYSPSQDSLFRLDYLFCSPLFQSICDSTILDMAISDHSPISLTIDILQLQVILKYMEIP